MSTVSDNEWMLLDIIKAWLNSLQPPDTEFLYDCLDRLVNAVDAWHSHQEFMGRTVSLFARRVVQEIVGFKLQWHSHENVRLTDEWIAQLVQKLQQRLQRLYETQNVPVTLLNITSHWRSLASTRVQSRFQIK